MDKKQMKVPKGMKKLSDTVKTEKMDDYKYDPRPSFDLNLQDLPAMKDWKVGQEYSLDMKVKLQDYSTSIDSQTGKEKTRGSFRIVAVGVDADSAKE